jgi:hypothetical protein
MTLDSHASKKFIVLYAKQQTGTILQHGQVPNRHVKRNLDIPFDMPEIVTWYCYMRD